MNLNVSKFIDREYEFSLLLQSKINELIVSDPNNEIPVMIDFCKTLRTDKLMDRLFKFCPSDEVNKIFEIFIFIPLNDIEDCKKFAEVYSTLLALFKPYFFQSLLLSAFSNRNIIIVAAFLTIIFSILTFLGIF